MSHFKELSLTAHNLSWERSILKLKYTFTRSLIELRGGVFRSMVPVIIANCQIIIIIKVLLSFCIGRLK